MTEAENQAIEDMIDKHGMLEIIETIANIAHLKAEHITTNWQDNELAQRWKNVGASLMQSAGVCRKYFS